MVPRHVVLGRVCPSLLLGLAHKPNNAETLGAGNVPALY